MGGGPTGITYDTAGTPPEVVAEDDLIKRFPMPIEKDDVRVVPVDQMFEKVRRRRPFRRRIVIFGYDVLSRTAASEFTARFGRPPRWVVAAPGRVNIIGEHTDYSGGLVLPMAIDRHTVIAAAPAPRADAGQRLRLHSAAMDESVDIPLAATPVPGEPRWANYARGVVAGFGARGLVRAGADALVISDVPLGGGLSSSAAFEVATATLLEAALGTHAGPDREGAPLPAGGARLRAGPVRDHGPAHLRAGRRGRARC